MSERSQDIEQHLENRLTESGAGMYNAAASHLNEPDADNEMIFRPTSSTRNFPVSSVNTQGDETYYREDYSYFYSIFNSANQNNTTTIGANSALNVNFTGYEIEKLQGSVHLI